MIDLVFTGCVHVLSSFERTGLRAARNGRQADDGLSDEAEGEVGFFDTVPGSLVGLGL